MALPFQVVEAVSLEGAPPSRTAHPVAWFPPLCQRTRDHCVSSSSVFLCGPCVPVVTCLSLADLPHVPTIAPWHVRTLPPLPALPHAGLLASSSEARWCERFPVPYLNTGRTPSLLALRRVDQGRHLHGVSPDRSPTIPFWVRCLTHFPLLLGTAPPMPVPRVRPPRVPLADACCVVLGQQGEDGSFESHLPRCSRAHDKV
jgi:hypothetical protein